MHRLSNFGLKKFAGAVMWVLRCVFAMSDVCLICKPNEKERRFLLDEIMMAGNFGKYNERLSHTISTMGHAWGNLCRNIKFLSHYFEETFSETFFSLYHWLWRKL